MLFSSRRAPGLSERVRLLLWPRRSFARSARYVGWRIVRLKGDPHALALGVAIGFFVATLPIFGMQMLSAAVIAWALRGSIAAALLATCLANPIVTPLLWVAAYAAGQLALGAADPLSASEIASQFGDIGTLFRTYGASQASRMVWPLLKPLVIGSALIGALLAALGYWLTFHLATSYRHGRSESLLTTSAITGFPADRPT